MQLHPLVGRYQSFPPGNLHKPLRPALPTREQAPEARGTAILHPVGPETEKVRQNEMAEGSQDGGGVRGHEFISHHECIKNTSTNRAVLTEPWLNSSRGPQTPKRTRKIPS